MGDRRDYNDFDAFWDMLWGNERDYPGALAAISEAVSSQLPGRINGPADAYRHLLWSAELTRRFGEEKARELLELHEEMGEVKGDRADEIAMDRYNNELGIAIGREVRDWPDVVARVRLMISAASQDGSGHYALGVSDRTVPDEPAPMWLAPERWTNNPVREGGEDRLPTDETNWYTNPKRRRIDWVGGYLPDAYTSEGRYRYGDSNETHDPADPNDDLDRFIEQYRDEIEKRRRSGETESALPIPDPAVADSGDSLPAKPRLRSAADRERSARRARELAELMHDMQDVDRSADSLLLRVPESWSREELEEVMSSPGYRGFGPEGSSDVKNAVARWFGAHHGDRGKVARRRVERTTTQLHLAKGRNVLTDSAGRPVAEGHDAVAKHLLMMGRNAAPDELIRRLQQGLNRPMVREREESVRRDALAVDGVYGPKTRAALTRHIARYGVRDVLSRLGNMSRMQ